MRPFDSHDSFERPDRQTKQWMPSSHPPSKWEFLSFRRPGMMKQMPVTTLRPDTQIFSLFAPIHRFVLHIYTDAAVEPDIPRRNHLSLDHGSLVDMALYSIFFF
jgi:hypothetical protein